MQSRGYLSYLLRLWRTGQGTRSTWQASLESPLTGERRGFASLEELWAFVQAEMRAQEKEEKGINDP